MQYAALSRQEELAYVEGMVEVALKVPGHIDDIVKRLIKLARLRNDNRAIKKVYGGVMVCVKATSSVREITSLYDRQQAERMRTRWPGIFSRWQHVHCLE